jgi:hypothetical protein
MLRLRDAILTCFSGTVKRLSVRYYAKKKVLKYGEIEEVLTYSNMGDHMIGNTFVRFADEDQAAACLSGTQGRYYAGRKVTNKFSPVADFDNAKCRDYESNDCKRGQFCNFAHFMPVPRFVTNLLSKSHVWRSVERRKQKLRLKDRKDGWPPFPIGALRPERMDCIAKWNRIRERSGQKPKTFDERPETQSSLKLFRPGENQNSPFFVFYFLFYFKKDALKHKVMSQRLRQWNLR